jgi:hypothetical protein
MSYKAACAWMVLVGVMIAVVSRAAAEQDKEQVSERRGAGANQKLPRDVVQLVRSEAAMAELVSRRRAELEAQLASGTVRDEAERLPLYQQLALCDLLEQRYDEALKHIEKIRALEEKPGRRLVAGLFAQSMIAARGQVSTGPASTEYRQAFRRELARRLRELPWMLVAEEIQQIAAELEALSEEGIFAALRAGVQPALERGEPLSSEQVTALLQAYFQLRERLPLREQILQVLHEAMEAHREPLPDIWPARSVRLSADEPLNYVTMAVWDTGVDVELFKPVLQVNPTDWLDGLDNDDNGYVDDFYGIAFDADGRPVPELLPPLGEVAERFGELTGYLEGLFDLEAGIESAPARALRQHLDRLPAGELPRFLEELNLAADYVHGTHVAGIMIDGNPWARLVIARLTFVRRFASVAGAAEWAQRRAEMYRGTVEYLRQRRVRAVNMSWAESLREVEKALEAGGFVAGNAERRELAAKIFAVQREALEKAIRDAREILFVCAAGNGESEAVGETIPAGLSLPNLLVVGAVDRSGAPAGLTGFGPTVQVWANGMEVESVIPGGRRLKLSGSSMAAAAASNLAGKLLAIDPSLKPPELIQLICEGAEPRTAGSRQILLLNPKRSVELVRKRLVKPAGD